MREITHLFASREDAPLVVARQSSPSRFSSLCNEEKDFKTIHSNRSWSSNAGRGRQAIDSASAGPNFGRSISFRLEF